MPRSLPTAGGVPDDGAPDWATTYEARQFAPWSLTVDLVGFAANARAQDLDVLVIVRGQSGPFQGREALPGGFVHWADDLDARAAALRELHEETGQRDLTYLGELRTYDTFGRDPRQFAGHPDPGTGEWVATGTRVVSRAFLALLPRDGGRAPEPTPGFDAAEAKWVSVYAYLPWEDLRGTASRATSGRIVRELRKWAGTARPKSGQAERLARIDHLFGPADWNEELVSERWALLREAGLVEEAWRDRWGQPLPDAPRLLFGEPLSFDHREIVADALGTLRMRIKREVELARALAGEEFKLSELQAVFEAMGGRNLYASNFRRLITATQASTLVAPTGRREAPSGPGKPADFYRFLPTDHAVRLSPGLNLPWTPPEVDNKDPLD